MGIFDFFTNHKSERNMGLRKEKQVRLDIALYLNYMTFKEKKIDWEHSDDDRFLYESEYMGWIFKVGKRNKNIIESHFFLAIQKRGSDLEPIISENDISAVRDLAYSIEKELGIRGKGVEEELEDLRNMLVDNCEHKFS